jgi:nucleoside-diphosphate-sugar epimerase
MKKILIAGGAGYIGTVLTKELADRGYNPYVVDTLWYGNYLPDTVEIKNINISELKQKDIEPYDVVVFLGGVSNDPMAEYRPSVNFSENMANPSYLAYITRKAALETKTQKRFIYASTCSVYGYTANNLMSENDLVPPPHFPYGISKLGGERVIMSLEDEYFKPIALRKGTVGGWSPRMRFDLVVNVMTKVALLNKQIIINNPSLWRPLIDIRDVAYAYIRAIESNISITGVYNISYDNYTIGRLADEIKEELATFDKKTEIKTLYKEDLRNYKVSTDKAKKELDFVPKFSPRDSVRKILNNLLDKDGSYFIKEPSGELCSISDCRYLNLETFKKIF